MIIDETRLVCGVFQKELKNRFRCVVEINGKDELCYVPSSCRLSNFIDLEGKAVRLTPSVNSIGLPFTLFSTANGEKDTILNLSVANEVIFEGLRGRRFSFLGKRKKARRETPLGGYKADIFIDDTNTAIEVKTIITTQKKAIFPSVQSSRSIRQLEHIKSLLQRGYKACYMFVSLSPSVRSVVLDHTSPFYAAFLDCVNCGMTYYGCSLKLQADEITVAASLKIEL